MSTTLVLTNDWHFASRPPASRTDDYNGELFDLLDQTLQVAQKVNAVGICIAGDLLHGGGLPYPTLVRLFAWAERCRAADIALIAIPGNHDLKHDRYDSMGALPIGAVFGSGLFTNASRQVVMCRGVAVYGVPWPDGSRADGLGDIPKNVHVVMLHGYGTPEGGAIYGEHCWEYAALAKAAPHVRIWHLGHDHSDHGVTTLLNGAKVVNIGALSRGAVNQDNLTRKVKIAVATFDWSDAGECSATVLQVALKTRPVSEIFDLKLRARQAAEQQRIAEFVSQLKTGLAFVPAYDVAGALHTLPLSDIVRALAQSYIERAEQTV